jgi:hypothetical protein
MKTTRLIMLVGLAMAAEDGCSSDFPPSFVGDVSGTVQYNGTALAQLGSPVLIVGAYAYQPGFLDRLAAGERPVPHASFYVPSPAFGTTGISYRLSKLDAFDQGYFVTGVILNLMDATAGPVATGLYPDMSILFSNPVQGPLMVAPELTVENVDFVIADLPGSP